MIKKCLKCNENFEAKKDTAKYCSDSCRVMFNRNNPNKQRVLPVDPTIQAQVIYNSVLEMLGKINCGLMPTNLDAPRVLDLRNDEPPQFEAPKQTIFRSQDYFTKQIMSGVCEDAEGHRDFIQELNDSDLPNHIKQQLAAASRIKQP